MSEYKDMVKILNEYRPGEPEHKPGDVWQTAHGWAAWKKGEDTAEYGIQSKDAAEKYAKGDKVGYDDGDHEDDEEDSAGKLGGGDFERGSDDKGGDGKDPEPDLYLKAKAQGMTPGEYQAVYGPGGENDFTDYDGDGDADSADKGGEQYSNNINVQKSSIEGDDDAQKDAQMALQGQKMNRSLSNLKDAGHEDLAGALGSDLPEDEKMKILKHAMGDDWMGRTGKELGKNETLKINGKMYRKVQEETTTDKHPLRESYERIGGK